MNRTTLVALVALALPASALAQERQREIPPLEPGASQAEVDKALIAAPEGALRDQATVIKWKPDHTYQMLRRGTNDLVCYDRSGFPLDRPFSVQCTSLANLERVAQNLKAEAVGDRRESEALLRAMEENGTRVLPKFGSIWYSLSGPDADNIGGHQMTIAVPGATAESLGLPESRGEGGAWIMNPGTSRAHIMVPGR